MRTDQLDYDLPSACIARYPTPERDGARLLVVEQADFRDARIADWPGLLPEGALVVVNDTRVRRARLLGTRRPSGGRVELLLLSDLQGDPANSARRLWSALGRSNRPLAPGTQLEFQSLRARVVERRDAGELVVELETEGPVDEAIERVGHVPIPPYLNREDEPSDAERYQTVFATNPGSVAAPTAGLHLSQALLEALTTRGIALAYTTLHVGVGTFRPVQVPELSDHPMHSEWFEVNQALAGAIDAARARRAPVVAVGTTVVRALESAVDPAGGGRVRPRRATTDLLIQPGFEFRIVDGLLTNFHMPKSTLLALVGAFAGLERTQQAYRAALQRNYRFLSYGDAMWIPKRS